MSNDLTDTPPSRLLPHRARARGDQARVPSHFAVTLLFAAGWALMPARGLAQISSPSTDPVPPAPTRSVEPTLTRDSDGSVTLRAIRLEEPLRTDGRLDELIYAVVPPADDFIQQLPLEGEPTTEKTEAWIFFDDQNIYVSVRAWDSQPERMVANELRRDGRQINQGQNVAIVFDTFHDHRNGFYFQTNPLGVLRDLEVTDEGNPNPDWNTVWEVKTGQFDQGWTFEMVIPFRSLRYAGSGTQVWGVNIRRTVIWKNEVSFLTPIPASSGHFGIFRMSSHATLVGLETPAKSIDVEVKPYAISTMTTDREAIEPISNRATGDVGADLKYGLTQSLTANLTVNTDFAQVEADEEQINLTRFSQSFPEKREFFLEGRGIFGFGGGGVRGVGGGGGGGGRGGNPDVPVMFFSRRIGLSEGEAIPVRGGARLIGKVGPVTVGALNVQTGDAPNVGDLPTNFSVVRVKREILSRSSIGLIATHRTRMISQNGSNTVLGLDAQFQFRTDWEITSYYARSSTPEGVGDDASYRAQVAYNGDRYGFQIGHLMVGDAFNPEIGFLRRDDFRLNSVQARFSPRLFSSRSIRRLVWQASVNHVTDESGNLLESREAQGLFRTELESGDMWSIQYTHRYEFLDSDFQIAQDVVIPVGAYRFGAVSTTYSINQQHRLSGRLNAEYGSFFDGDRTAIGYSGRIEISPRFSLEPSLSQNWVDLAEGGFNTRLVTARAIFTPSARSALSSLIQYNSINNAWSSNVRLRWEYSPGSELFLVYSDSRDASRQGFPELQNRTLAVKITRLLRF